MSEIKIEKPNQEEVLDKVINDIREDLKKNKLVDAFGDLTTDFVKIYSDGILKEKAKTDYWKRKAYIFAQLYNQCPEHDTHHERSFDIWQMIKDKECKNCEWKKRK